MSDKNQGWWTEIDHQAEIENLEGFKETKQLLKGLDKDVAMSLPQGEDFFDQLHDKIMARVAQTEIKKDHRNLWQRHRRSLGGLASASLLAAVMLVGLDTQQLSLSQDDTDQVLSDAVDNSPDIQETVLVYQNKDDFFVDLAQESIDHVDHIEGLMKPEERN